MEIVLVANSPGELSALVTPMVDELVSKPEYHITLVLTPCQYNSGKELEFSKKIKGINAIVTASQYKQWILLNRRPSQLSAEKKGIILYLGGDLAHPALIARKLKFPLFAYVNDRIGWEKSYCKFFTPDQETFRKLYRKSKSGKVKVVGNLMVDSVAGLKKWNPAENVITFMPGSRRWEIDYMTPFYQQAIELIKRKEKSCTFQLASSPFIQATSIYGTKNIPFEDAHNSELIVTIPGTNTAKIAARGIPMLVVFPLNNPEVIPIDGIADLICKTPVLGKIIKHYLANLINKRTKYFALPNQKANKEIVPEIRGRISPAQVADKIIALLHNKPLRTEMSAHLIEAMGKPGAAKTIMEEINAAL